MLILIAPGQGAQKPGMLEPWLDLDGAADRLEQWSTVSGLDLIADGTTADADHIRDTAVAQPLLVAAGLTAFAALFPDPDEAAQAATAVAGHSVGELTAAAMSRAITPESALLLARERGAAMASAAAAQPTGMTALLGGAEDEVRAKLAEHGLTVANVNGSGQMVAAGTTEQLAALAADPPARSRLRPLQVAGAFHTEHMAPAVTHLSDFVSSIDVGDPRVGFISNADGAVVTTGQELVKRLVAQVSSPVRWDRCQEAMAELGVTGVIEMAPAGTLTAMLRRALPDVESVNLSTPDDLAAATDLIKRHGAVVA